ncbi:MAG: DUF354 domain-containing protein [Candidatus Methanoperedens sp.]
MRILVGISHPKHVFMFKNLIKTMEAKGHEFELVVVEKEITGYLLEQFKIKFNIIGINQPTLIRKILALPILEYKTLKIALKFKPDLFIGQAFPPIAHVSAILNKPFIVCEDTEVARHLHKVVLPFADAIVTPNCYKDDLGKKHVRFKGFFELAYLHPKNFEPDSSVLADLGLNSNDKYVIIRLVSWHAHHDFGHKGMSLEIIKKLIEELEKHAKIYISSECSLPDELQKYEIKLSPIKMHSILYYATMYLGESGTMATEAGILGTPSIYISSLASAMGNFEKMEKKYGLMNSYSDPLVALDKALETIKNNNIKEEWKLKRHRMLEDSIDVNKLLMDIIENINNS